MYLEFVFHNFSAVSDLTLGLVSCQSEETSCSSKTVICDNVNHHRKQPENSNLSHSQTSPSLKRKRRGNAKTTGTGKQLLPGNQTRLTAVSSLPRFTCVDNCSKSVVLTWTSHSSDGSLDHHSMHCGYVTLFTDQIMAGTLQLNRNLDPKSIQQDIEALKSVSIETEVTKMQYYFTLFICSSCSFTLDFLVHYIFAVDLITVSMLSSRVNKVVRDYSVCMEIREMTFSKIEFYTICESQH